MAIKFVDCHAHVSGYWFDEDLDQVVERAKKAGVITIIDCGESLADVQKVLNTASKYPIVKPCIGNYPTYLDQAEADQVMDLIRENVGVLVGIGEVGLDYWKVKEEPQREIQRKIFKKQIDLSKELDLPLNVHCRSAGHYAIDFLIKNGAEKVQIHAFDGKAVYAQKAVEAGYYFSIPPSIARSEQEQKLVQSVPLENLLLETDSPFLGATKEEKNEPANVRVAAEWIAKIKETTIDEVAKTMTKNAKNLYSL